MCVYTNIYTCVCILHTVFSFQKFITCPGADFLGLMLPIHSASWMCRIVSFARLERRAVISLNTIFVSFSTPLGLQRYKCELFCHCHTGPWDSVDFLFSVSSLFFRPNRFCRSGLTRVILPYHPRSAAESVQWAFFQFSVIVFFSSVISIFNSFAFSAEIFFSFFIRIKEILTHSWKHFNNDFWKPSLDYPNIWLPSIWDPLLLFSFAFIVIILIRDMARGIRWHPESFGDHAVGHWVPFDTSFCLWFLCLIVCFFLCSFLRSALKCRRQWCVGKENPSVMIQKWSISDQLKEAEVF